MRRAYSPLGSRAAHDQDGADEVGGNGPDGPVAAEEVPEELAINAAADAAVDGDPDDEGSGQAAAAGATTRRPGSLPAEANEAGGRDEAAGDPDAVPIARAPEEEEDDEEVAVSEAAAAGPPSRAAATTTPGAAAASGRARRSMSAAAPGEGGREGG